MATENATQEGSLVDFAFDTDTSFFGIPNKETDEMESVIKEVKSEKNEEGEATEVTSLDEKNKKDKEESEKDDEPEFFAETKETKSTKEKVDKVESKEEDEEESTDDEVDDKKEKSEEDDDFFETLASELKEKGIFQNIEIKEGEKITEEKFFELQDAEIEARVEETFETFFEEMDEDAKAFLKFKKNGGSTGEFFQNFGNELTIETLDSENEAQRNYVIEHYLTTVEKMDSEEVEDRLKWLKENGKDKAYAEKYFNKIEESKIARREHLIKSQEEAAKLREQSIKEFNKGLEETLQKTENVGAFKFSKVEQKELSAYVTKPTVKVGKNKYVPSFQAEISKIFRAEKEEDKQKLLLIAKLVKSNFDVADLVTETKTKVVKEAKSKLQQAKAGIKPASSGNYTKKSLSDYFN